MPEFSSWPEEDIQEVLVIKKIGKKIEAEFSGHENRGKIFTRGSKDSRTIDKHLLRESILLEP